MLVKKYSHSFVLALLALHLVAGTLQAQNTIGLPDVVNYTKEAYSAGLQNWDFQQDSSGIIYAANNEGLLSFDGRYWNLHPLPNRTIVRSVAIGTRGRIYAGGQDELGYFSAAGNGRLQYHSLTGVLPEKDRSFGDVWDIVVAGENVFFRCPNKIFKLTNDKAAVFYPTSEWSFMGLCNGRLYAHDYTSGLMLFDNNMFSPLPAPNLLATNDPVTGLLPLPGDTALVTTLKNGLYYLVAGRVSKLTAGSTAFYASQRIYAAALLQQDRVALATSNGGVFISDTKGQLIQHFSTTERLQNNNVLSVFPDRQGNLWLGLDNGIDFIAYSSAIKQISPQNQDGAGYAAMVMGNQLYIGTSNGLFNVTLQPGSDDISFSKGFFQPVGNTTGQVWGLATVNNQLLLGHHEGAFAVNGQTASSLGGKGIWNFVALSATFPANRMVTGSYNGLQFYNYKSGVFTAAGSVPDFTESSRFVVMDAEDRIWVSHPYHGVYRLTPAGNGQYTTVLYTVKEGLPSTLNNHVYKVKNEIVVGTEKGVYGMNATGTRFEPLPFYTGILGSQSIRYLKEDGQGNIWFVHDKSLGVVDMGGAQPAVIYLPELNRKMLSGFELIYPLNSGNIFVSGEKGFFHINYDKYKKNIPTLQVQIRTVRISHGADSLLYGGYAVSGAGGAPPAPAIGHHWKTIRIEYAAPLFGYLANLEYSYRLKGFDEAWSPWTPRTDKEYTNLPPGGYTFEVKVRNNLGNESVPASYTFKISPPWYQTGWAWFLYALLLALLVYALYRWQKRKFIRQQVKYEEEQKRLSYIHELEMGQTENELVALRNEKLEAELGYKNSELAASAMHLVKKGELLTRIRAELTQVMKGLDNAQATAEMKRLIRALDEDDNIDKEWENFARHFDQVHQGFFTLLKERHPNLTGNELKLCAHLRMNLSSKEIAQLMNIGLRGVEISRYRLRKKLGIGSEVSLFDYLMGLG